MMKERVTCLCLFIFMGFSSYAQVAINSSGNPPNSAAMLDVNSSNKGFLPPRLSTLEMNAISSPPEGLMLYNTTLKGMVYYNGSSWKLVTNLDGEPCGHFTYGGQTYTSVVIGMQCWMRQNLNIGTRINISSEQTNNSILEKYCYDDNDTKCDIYGGLYLWDEMMDYTTSSSTNPSGRQGICPTGWHLPSHGEWQELSSYLGGDTVSGGKMKEEGTSHWNTPNTGGTNSSGLTVLPGGGFTIYEGVPYTIELHETAVFWTATEQTSTNAIGRILHYYNDNIEHFAAPKTERGYSVRCVKD